MFTMSEEVKNLYQDAIFEKLKDKQIFPGMLVDLNCRTIEVLFKAWERKHFESILISPINVYSNFLLSIKENYNLYNDTIKQCNEKQCNNSIRIINSNIKNNIIKNKNILNVLSFKYTRLGARKYLGYVYSLMQNATVLDLLTICNDEKSNNFNYSEIMKELSFSIMSYDTIIAIMHNEPESNHRQLNDFCNYLIENNKKDITIFTRFKNPLSIYTKFKLIDFNNIKILEVNDEQVGSIL